MPGTPYWVSPSAYAVESGIVATGALNPLLGGIDNDRLDGGLGSDRVEGQDGDDLLIANLDGADNMPQGTASGDDTLDGGSGTDTVVYKYESGNSRIVLSNALDDGFFTSATRAHAADFGLTINHAADAANDDYGAQLENAA